MGGDDWLAAGAFVVTRDLVKKAELNGLVGQCKGGGATRGDDGRVAVQLLGMRGTPLMKPQNLLPACEVLQRPEEGKDLTGSEVIALTPSGWAAGTVLLHDAADGSVCLELVKGDEVDDVPVGSVRLLPSRQQLRCEAKAVTDKETAKGVLHGAVYGSSSMQGWRPTNEDAHCAIALERSKVAVFGVFDGHGSAAPAIHASRAIPSELEQRLPACIADLHSASSRAAAEEEVAAALRAAFLAADASLPADVANDGSTANVVIFAPGVVVTANVGDSRAVLAVGGLAERLSEDHKPTVPKEKQRIEAAGRRVQLGRIDGRLATSRAIGDADLKDSGLPPERQACTAVPDVGFRYLQPGEKAVLVQACDGLWDGLSDKAAAAFVVEKLAEGLTPVEVAKSLCDAVLAPSGRRGAGTDNVTVNVAVLPPPSP